MPKTSSDSKKRCAELSDENSSLSTPPRKKVLSCAVNLTPLGKGIVSAARRLNDLEKSSQVENGDIKTLSDSSDYDDSSDEDQEDRLKKFVRERDRINQTKRDILKKLAIVEYTKEISCALAKEKQAEKASSARKTSQRKFKQSKSPPPAKRQSLRLLGKDPNGIGMPPEPEYYPVVKEKPRRPGKEFAMNAIGFEEDPSIIEEYDEVEQNEMKDYGNFMKSLTDISDVPDYLGNGFLSLASHECHKELQRLTTKPEHVLKVTKSRIFSLAIHPSLTEILVAAGDKEGYLGLWKPMLQDCNDGAYMFRPHTRPISCLKFSLYDLKLYMCSYDGQFRSMDLTRNVFDETFINDEDFAMSGFDFLQSTHSLIVSRADGCLSIIDTRATKKNSINTYKVYERAAKCVSCHPMQRHYVSTSHRDGSVFIFDVRKLAKNRCKPVAELKGHKRSTSSAYFSPNTGKQILTTSYDNHLRIFDTSVIADDQIRLKSACYHNNQTGRWLSSFRAVWHPRADDVFVVGSMNEPRQIELYEDSAKLLHAIKDENLGTVCSINCFHDSLNILAGGNSSGKVYLFSDGVSNKPQD